MSTNWCTRVLWETIENMAFLKYSIQIKEVNIPVRFTQNAFGKISMDGKRHAIDNIFIERMWGYNMKNIYLQKLYRWTESLRGT
jgi:hypothetical protein